ncbi:MAG TPA: hypothetical protein VHO95_02805, partial [Candidatus Dormibacteraeota bacterium]|nr:hypothetical protein [Candidatus Dormibacteraeota bacterium]
CAATIGLTIAAGLSSEEVLTLPTFVVTGLIGALVASRAPANSVGWLMCASSLIAVLLFLPLDYGYAGQVTRHGAWPLGGVALWLGGWTWAPVVGLALPVLTVRFPSGKVPRGWRVIDWLAIAGTALFMVSVALAPVDVVARFLLIHPSLASTVAPHIVNPLGARLPSGVADSVSGLALLAIVMSYVLSVFSVIYRFRSARGDERLQLKWFAYAGVIIGVAGLFQTTAGIVSETLSDQLSFAIHVSFLALPIAIGIAILRYHLYDIDLIINRTLVYGILTAILGAVYAAVVTLLNRLFIAASGQKSDAAYVVTAFVVVVASSPIKDWLQRQVDRRVVHRSPSAVLGELKSDVDSVVSVIDVHRIARRLLDEAATAFDARGAAVYLQPDSETPLFTRGSLNGETCVEIELRFAERKLGRLVLGSRRGDLTYSPHDLAALQQSADSIAEALALAAHLGFRPLPRQQT